jgi:hypothetical protein
MFQRIGLLRPSARERRWWVIEGVVIVGIVLVIGALLFLALR